MIQADRTHRLLQSRRLQMIRKSLRSIFLVLALTLLASAGSPFAFGQTAQATKYRTIFHVTEADPRKWAQVLNNASYAQTEMGAKNIEIVVVMNGGGIGMLQLESPVAQKVEDAKKAGIRFHVCKNTMETQKLTEQDMLPEAEYVKSGIGDVIKLQQQGWSYVKN